MGSATISQHPVSHRSIGKLSSSCQSAITCSFVSSERIVRTKAEKCSNHNLNENDLDERSNLRTSDCHSSTTSSDDLHFQHYQQQQQQQQEIVYAHSHPTASTSANTATASGAATETTAVSTSNGLDSTRCDESDDLYAKDSCKCFSTRRPWRVDRSM